MGGDGGYPQLGKAAGAEASLTRTLLQLRRRITMPWREFTFSCGVEMPEVELDFYNRGKSSNAVWQLKWRWQTDAVDFKPDLLSMLIT